MNIADDHIEVSSSWRPDHGSQRARLNTKKDGQGYFVI